MTATALGGAALPLEPPVAAALTEPTERVSGRYASLYTVASIAMWMAFNTPSQILIVEQAQALDPSSTKKNVAIILTVGAFVSLVANPVAGVISDATTSRFGRRRPWAMVGALGGAASLGVLAVGHGLPMLTLGWSLCQLTLNILLAVVMAMVPDRVPHAQRGYISGLAGVAQIGGTVVGLAVASVAPGGFPAKYATLAVLLVATVALLVVGVADPPPPPGTTQPLSWKRLAQSLWVNPVRHPDFGWAWLTRFLVMLGNAIGLTFLLIFLTDAVHYEKLFPGHKADEGVLILTAIAGAAILVTTVIGGVLSDRLQRRKIFVMVSTCIVAAGLVLLAVSPTWPAAIVAAVLLGSGFGAYLAVDVALITEVLPNPDDRGKDLGVINIANTLPQTFAPVICAGLVALGGYPTMFGVAAVVTLLGAVLVQPIKGVR